METEEMVEGMTDERLNTFLEVVAKLVENIAKDTNDAARIIREAKPK